MKIHELIHRVVFPVMLVQNAVRAQDTLHHYTGQTFTLGEVLVTARQDPDTFEIISASQMEKFNTVETSRALSMLSGVNLGMIGPRNESVVYVRGFDLRQVPVFIDGIPVYVPYDGYVDLARFSTTDLAKIQVDKGFSSVLYGPNTMGGAINLISRKPTGKLEYNGQAGIFSGQGRRLNLNLGSRQNKFYLQGGFSFLEQQTYPLSGDFAEVASENGGDRENADRRDLKVDMKVGFTPNEKDEYAIGYVRQDGTKGNPPYTGDDPNIRIRYWQWPYWDKESLYALSNTEVGSSVRLKMRMYYDKFKNALYSFDDETYTAHTRPYAFQSFYDDYSYGGNTEVSMTMLPANLLKIGAYYKHDTHRENNLGEPQRTMTDHTISLAVEDQIDLGEKWRLVPGMSYNIRNSVLAEDYQMGQITPFPDNDNSAFNIQAALWHWVTSGHQLKASVARKTRFATLKDRYSYRLGSAIPNPDLKAEVANHYELAYIGSLNRGNPGIKINLFYSDVVNAIQQVDNVQDDQFQLQNTGSARFTGLELGLNLSLNRNLQFNTNYTYINQKNLDRPDIKFINVPRHQLFTYVDWQVTRRLDLLVSLEHNSDRYSTSYGTKAEAFSIANVSFDFLVFPWLGLEAGINNVFDLNYALVEGFPAQGRNFMLTLRFDHP